MYCRCIYQKQHRPCNFKQLDVGPCNRRYQKVDYKAQLFNFGIHRVEVSICQMLVIGLTREDSNRSSRRRVIIKERSLSDLTEQISEITWIKFGSF